MSKRAILAVLIAIFLAYTFGGCKKKDKIEETYISDLTKDYKSETMDAAPPAAETNIIDIVVETENKKPTKMPSAVLKKPILPNVPKKNITYKDIYPWVDTVDSKEIKHTRDLIAREKYQEAKKYVDSLDIEKLKDTDIGHLYQFKGIICYFLVEEDSNQFAKAIEYFEKVYNTTKIEKFEPLSLLWLGMLYEKYSYNEEELNAAIVLFDRIINEYAKSRFVNDAIFYKILVMKKLGKDPSEYADLQLSLKNGIFVDDYIYSKWQKDYVRTAVIINKAFE